MGQKQDGTAPYPGDLNRVGIEKFTRTNRLRSIAKGNGMPLKRVNEIVKAAGRDARLHATKGWKIGAA